MHIDELETPLRLSWDLYLAGTGMSGPDCSRAVDEIVSAGLFFVTLEEQPLLHPRYPAIIRELTAAGVQLSVVCHGTDAELAVLKSCEESPVSLLFDLRRFVGPDGVDNARISSTVTALRATGQQPVFTLTPSRANITHLLDLAELAEQLGIPRFKLPNVRIDDSFLQSEKGLLLTPDDVSALAEQLAGRPPLPTSLELEIHDLFLWEILAPQRSESRAEYGGCQAANTLAHLRVDGTVWPCLSWPLPLGSLVRQSFAEIWESRPRRALRERIAQRPAGCENCADYSICFGGCRGLAETLGTADDRDPLCRGTR